jgi:uncharacterized membrane protein
MDQGQPSNAQQEPFGVDEPQGPRPPSTTDNDRLLAGLSYLSQLVVPAVLPVILMLTDETKAKCTSFRSDFVRFHAVHGLALFVAAVIYELAAVIVFAIIGAIAPFLACLTWILFLAPFAVLIYYGVLAFQGKRTEIPWLTQFLRDNNWL